MGNIRFGTIDLTITKQKEILMKVENKQMLNPTGIGIKKVLIVTLTVLALGQAVWAQQAGDSPLKIFILAGQSNME